MLPSRLLKIIQDLMNSILRQDDRALASIRELAGKLILIQVTGTDLNIFVKFEKESLLLASGHDAKPDVTIRARPMILAGQLLNRGSKAPGITPDMEINGDTHLAQQFQQILGNLEMDWEEHLSRWIGDIPAHQIGRLFRTTRSCLQETGRNFGMDISEYLRYEKDILPIREDISAFVTAVDVLRDDVERLQQRFDRLRRKIN